MSVKKTITKSSLFHGYLKKFSGPIPIILITISMTKRAVMILSMIEKTGERE